MEEGTCHGQNISKWQEAIERAYTEAEKAAAIQDIVPQLAIRYFINASDIVDGLIISSAVPCRVNK